MGVLIILALLDYVSRAHEIEIRPSSHRVAIISEPNAQVSFKFWLLLPPGPYAQTFFEGEHICVYFLRIFCVFFHI